MAFKPFVGTGATLSFDQSKLTLRLSKITGGGTERASADVTPLNVGDAAAGSFGNAEYIPGKIVRVAPMSVEVYFDPTNDPRDFQGKSAELITLTYPRGDLDEFAGEEKFQGFITNCDDMTYARDEVVMISFRLQVTGAVSKKLPGAASV